MKKKIITISFISFLSIVLWVSVALSQEFITTIEVPVSFSDLPKNYSVGSASTNQVFIQLKGKGWELLKVYVGSKENYQVSVRRRIGKNKNLLSDFVGVNTWLNSRFQVLEIAPSQIEYEVERVYSKRVKISKTIDIEFKQNYAATSAIKVEPAFVDVRGPSSVLMGIDSIKMVTKSFQNVSENFSEEFSLEETQGVTYSVSKCMVQFEVQKIVEKKFDSIPITIINNPASKELSLSPSYLDIIIRGGINKLGKMNNDSIKVIINYWNVIRSEDGLIEPEIVLPKFVTLISTEPKRIEYIIKQY